jgi:rubredoxin
MIWQEKQTVRILARGGILTPPHLLKILGIVKSTNNKHVHFGSRQDLLFQVTKKQMPAVKEAFTNIQTRYIIHGRKGPHAQNTVSSYVASDLSATTSWLSSGNYLNILENFNYLPTFRINIADPRQSLVPLFYGDLNFIASPVKDYWYLYIRRSHNAIPECWPVLILSNDIAALSKTLEDYRVGIENLSIADLFEFSLKKLNYNWRKIETSFTIENLPPQDYEGFGKMYNAPGYWAGFYWRNNSYDIPFLEEVCNLCIRTNISKICLTPWKSFLVKEIKENDLIHWHRLLGRFGINMRHSSFELNWHLPLLDKPSLRLKRFIVKEFDKVDVCVHGLTFGIKTKPEPMFCSIQIEKIPGLKFLKGLDIFTSYKVMFAKNFNANTCEYQEYASQVPRYRLPQELHQLTLKYYAQLLKTNETHNKETKAEKLEVRFVHQCTQCFTVYDEKNEGEPFIHLPETYTCPLCEAPKAHFKPVLLNSLIKEAKA